ncbi:MAG: hemolysin D, partial [Porticoccus sp.]
MINTLKKYATLIIDAWNNRAAIGDGTKELQTLDFLPAALEIQERPPSPAGRILGWSLMAFFTIAVLWAMIGQVNIVA